MEGKETDFHAERFYQHEPLTYQRAALKAGLEENCFCPDVVFRGQTDTKTDSTIVLCAHLVLFKHTRLGEKRLQTS